MSVLEIRYEAIRRGRAAVLEAGHIRMPMPATIAVAGINGSGKTSLFMQLTGTLLGASRKSARIMVNGRLATLAYVPQAPALPGWPDVPVLTAAFGLDWRVLVASLPQLALDEIPVGRVSRLSPGQRQAVLLAIALGRRPDVLLLDEPLSALDFRRRAGALQLLRERAAAGQSLLMSSPSAADFVGLCNHLLVLHRGRCIFDGAVFDLAASDLVADVERALLRLVR